MQSGSNKAKYWYLEHCIAERHIDQIMGWTSSTDTQHQVKLRFETLEEAEQYARNNQIPYEVVQPQIKNKKSARSYIKNYQ
jgi:hypothetical protein